MKNVIEMTTKEMIAEYNTLTGKNITKFSTRAVGEKQLERARAYYGAQEQAAEEVAAEEVAADTFDAPEEIWAAKKEYHYSEDGCPNCGAKEDITPAGEENTAAGERLFCHNCSTEFHQNGKIYKARSTGGISEGVKKSWANPEVAAARAKRDAVSVEGKGEFKSVAAAFKALNLPMAKHIKFRMELKAKGAAKFMDYNFSIVSK